MKLSDVIKQFRAENDLSQRQMGAQCGLSTGYISLIEKEINPQTGKPMVPSLPVMNKLAIGMGLTLDELLSVCDDMDVSLNERDAIASQNTECEHTELVNGDPELTAYLDSLRTRPEMRMLFSVAKDATKQDIEKAVAIIEALRKTEGR